MTHRGTSSGFTVITGFQNQNNRQVLDWEAIARLGTTLVILMGASRAGDIGDSLLAGGAPASTPVAIVTKATTVQQSSSRLALGDLGNVAIENPSIIVVGPAAALELSVVAHGEASNAFGRNQEQLEELPWQ